MNEKFAVNVVVPASLEMGYVNQGSTVFDQEKIDKLADSLGANFEVSPIEYDGHALRGTYRKDGVTVVPKQYENAIAGRLEGAKIVSDIDLDHAGAIDEIVAKVEKHFNLAK
ncbi:hypothetical protein [Ligilactobacillus ruminis]|nr:hypothetical protein [Ligilactobacillus ruminis]KRM81392.1 hypothetical protein FC25_GL002005 [Ligilactobacillus ruminis DSM 20403 = NBRC 102161]MCF2544294.1 hypothetical protein [Ligilactobacillus ruminis]MCR5748933.1 hypothetical protein [Lactobacillus sp.]